MSKFQVFWLMMLLVAVSLPAQAFTVLTPELAKENHTIVFFYSDTCPHCAQMKPFLASLELKYPELHVVSLEINENQEMLEKISSEYNTVPLGVPRVFISDKAFVGFSDTDGDLEFNRGYLAYVGYSNQIENAIRACLDLACFITHRRAEEISRQDALVDELLAVEPESIPEVKLLDDYYVVAWWRPQSIQEDQTYPDVVVNLDAITGEILKSRKPSGTVEGFDNPLEESGYSPTYAFYLILVYLVSYVLFHNRSPRSRKVWIAGLLTLVILSVFWFAVSTPDEVVQAYAIQFPFPVFVFILALMDGFNPCAFAIFIVLLSLLTRSRNRSRMALIGGIFVFTSALMYSLFIMAILLVGSWMFAEHISTLITITGVVVAVAGAINIKDYFFFKEGISLTVSEDKKDKVLRKAGKLVMKMDRARTPKELLPVMVGTFFLAALVNLIELGCTAILPIAYMGALFSNHGDVVGSAHILYTIFYSIVYVTPLLVILAYFIYTLKVDRMTEEQGRVLKLIGGLLMLALGLILLFKPELLVLG